MIKKIEFEFFLIVALFISIPCVANESNVDPTETQIVLRALLSASNEVIPAGSSCKGNYGQLGQARLKDLLSAQLAYLYQGDNKIIGKRQIKGDSKHCVLNITHVAGEDVYSAEIRFTTRKGKVIMNTLHCLITP